MFSVCFFKHGAFAWRNNCAIFSLWVCFLWQAGRQAHDSFLEVFSFLNILAILFLRNFFHGFFAFIVEVFYFCWEGYTILYFYGDLPIFSHLSVGELRIFRFSFFWNQKLFFCQFMRHSVPQMRKCDGMNEFNLTDFCPMFYDFHTIQRPTKRGVFRFQNFFYIFGFIFEFWRPMTILRTHNWTILEWFLNIFERQRIPIATFLTAMATFLIQPQNRKVLVEVHGFLWRPDHNPAAFVVCFFDFLFLSNPLPWGFLFLESFWELGVYKASETILFPEQKKHIKTCQNWQILIFMYSPSVLILSRAKWAKSENVKEITHLAFHSFCGSFSWWVLEDFLTKKQRFGGFSPTLVQFSHHTQQDQDGSWMGLPATQPLGHNRGGEGVPDFCLLSV